MDTAKKTTYHPAKTVGNTIFTGLLLEKTMNLMRQICFLSVMEQIIFILNEIHETIQYKHATEENVHHGMSFILHLNFVYQKTIQPNMTNRQMPHCLLMEGSFISQFKEQNAICLDVKWLQSALIFGHHNMNTRPPGERTNKRFWTKANLCISKELFMYRQAY